MEISKDQVAKCTDIIRNKLKEVKHLENIHTGDNYIQRFLYSTDFDVEKAFDRMVLYHETMTEIPEFYPKYSPLEKKDVFDLKFGLILPDCDKEGRPIYFQKIGNLNSHEIDFTDMIAVNDCWMEFVFSQHPEIASKGVCVVMDVKDYNWNLFKWLKPNLVRKANKRTDSLPVKEIHVHLINYSTAIDIVINFVWPFIPEQRKKLFHPHFNNLESLYKYIDRSILPKEYGGDKDVNYDQIYQQLFDRNDEIANNFRLFRNVKKN